MSHGRWISSHCLNASSDGELTIIHSSRSWTALPTEEIFLTQHVEHDLMTHNLYFFFFLPYSFYWRPSQSLPAFGESGWVQDPESLKMAASPPRADLRRKQTPPRGCHCTESACRPVSSAALLPNWRKGSSGGFCGRFGHSRL